MAQGKAQVPAENDTTGASRRARRSLKDTSEQQVGAGKRSYLKQTDVPIASLDDALRIPQAIFDHYAGKPTAPFNIAKALNVDPKGSQLRVLSGAAIAFGLIEGGAQASVISVTDLARRIIRPKIEDEDIEAKREAVLKPRIFGEFLRNYDGNQFPRQDLALNVLEDMGVPRDKAEEVLERISESARSVGFIEELKGKYYVRLEITAGNQPAREAEQIATLAVAERGNGSNGSVATAVEASPRVLAPPPIAQSRGAAMPPLLLMISVGGAYSLRMERTAR